jgi:hypothetical protein
MTKRHGPTKGDVTEAALETLVRKHGGRVGPSDLLDEACDPASPFHCLFEWDDSEAADLYRLAQAAGLLRRWRGSIIRIHAQTREVEITTTRRVESPQGERGKGRSSYMPTEKIMADPQMRDDMIRTVLRELSAYRKRYSDLVALSEVWRAIDDAMDLHSPPDPRPTAGDLPRPAA